MNEIFNYLTSWHGVAVTTLVSLIGWALAVVTNRVRRTGGLWSRIARFAAKPDVANWLISRSLLTPYTHLVDGPNGAIVVDDDYRLKPGESFYMRRFWLFNAYSRDDNVPTMRLTLKLFGRTLTWAFPISIRIHHIMREDGDRDPHDHPWNARTIILKGHYLEIRDNPEFEPMLPTHQGNQPTKILLRRPGATAALGFEEYHRICEVAPGGTWTLFISGPWRGVWGFRVNGVKVPWRAYLSRKPAK
jgi:hypothetical protein